MPRKDFTQIALDVVRKATGEAPMQPAAPAPGKRKGGLAGGKARAAKLPPEERAAIAKKAAVSRWKKQATAPAEGAAQTSPKKAKVRL
jgi:hypothetical protein